MSRKRYPTDLTDGQWACIAPHIPKAKPGGRLHISGAATSPFRQIAAR